MSTKIYDGKIIKPQYLEKFHNWFYNYCIGEIYKLALKANSCCDKTKVNAYIDEKLAESEKNNGKEVADRLRSTNYFKYDRAFLILVSQAALGEVLLNPSCGYNIYPSGDDFLIILFVPGSNYCSKIKFPKYVRDYCYYDNTDRPSKVSAEEWNVRGKRWHSAFQKYESRIGCDIFRFVNQPMYENIEMVKTLEKALNMFPDYNKNHRMMSSSVDRAFYMVKEAIGKDNPRKSQLSSDIEKMLANN